jgi:hypothetical protein
VHAIILERRGSGIFLRRLLCEQVVCLITEKKEHTDHFPFSFIFLFILKRKKRNKIYITKRVLEEIQGIFVIALNQLHQF